MPETRPPQVMIVLGSDSDWPKIEAAAEVLDQFRVPYEVHVASAHRSPERARQLALEAAERGVRVVIAAAGGAAHLPGVIAAYTTLPVIGIPVATSLAGGLDSLLSIVQMPPDVPVAAVGTNAGRNAAILAVQILALADPLLRSSLEAFKKSLPAKVASKHTALQQQLADRRTNQSS